MEENEEVQKVKKINPMDDLNPEEYWDEVIKVNKNNIKYEEGQMQQYNDGMVRLKRDAEKQLDQLNLEREEMELLKKLYPKHDEDYVKTPEWKDHMQKKLTHTLSLIALKIKDNDDILRVRLNQGKSSISTSKQNIVKYTKTIKEAKKKMDEPIDPKLSIVG